MNEIHGSVRMEVAIPVKAVFPTGYVHKDTDELLKDAFLQKHAFRYLESIHVEGINAHMGIIMVSVFFRTPADMPDDSETHRYFIDQLKDWDAQLLYERYRNQCISVDFDEVWPDGVVPGEYEERSVDVMKYLHKQPGWEFTTRVHEEVFNPHYKLAMYEANRYMLQPEAEED